MTTRRRILLATWLVMVATWGFIGWAWWERHHDECFNAPKVVQFHQGMTICPGQSAQMTIIIPLPDDDAPTPKEDAKGGI
jgi:hypothetical protein